MKVCPQCNVQYEDSMFFCLEDGTALRSPTDINLEQTMFLPSAERIQVSPTIEENRGNLPSSFEETLALPVKPLTSDNSVQTEAWQPLTSPPRPFPLVNVDHNPGNTNPTHNLGARETNELVSKRPGGKGKFIILAGLLGGFVLVASGYVGWWLSQPSSKNVAVVTNVNKETANLNTNNGNSTPSNLDVLNEGNVGIIDEPNSNVANIEANPSPSANHATPKPSPTKDKSPTPTPNDTSTPTPSITPVPKTPTPTPTPAPTQKTPDLINGGVLNRRADILYQPRYPPAAKENGIGGTVNVQVLVDENGRVLNASAVNGHPLLRGPAEAAARSTKFPRMTSGGQPIRVSGILVFKFVP